MFQSCTKFTLSELRKATSDYLCTFVIQSIERGSNSEPSRLTDASLTLAANYGADGARPRRIFVTSELLLCKLKKSVGAGLPNVV